MESGVVIKSSMQQSGKKRYCVRVLLLVVALLTGIWTVRAQWRRVGQSHIEKPPDSGGYHFLAVNLLQGEGYYQTPRSLIPPRSEMHRLWFPAAFEPEQAKSELTGPAMNRPPGYPLALALIYAVHGEFPDRVLRYQKAFVCVTAICLVLSGWFVWKWRGVAMGALAAFLFGTNEEASYPVVQLLSECMSTMLLTAAFTAALWAAQGKAWRQATAGILMGLAVLTRPGLVFVPLIYSCLIVFDGGATCPIGNVRQDARAQGSDSLRWKRVLWLLVPLCMLLMSWSLYASMLRGELVLLGGNGKTVFLAGINPRQAALDAGLVVPRFTPDEMEAFWMAWPGAEHGSGACVREFKRAPSRWREVAHLCVLKIQALKKRVSASLWLMMLMGTGFLGAVWSNGSRISVGLPRSAHRQSVVHLMFVCLLAATVGFWFLATLGYSHPCGHVCAIAFMILAPLRFVSGAEDRARFFPLRLVLAWPMGLLLMTIVFFGHSRFMRPFYPVLYFNAVAGAWMAVAYVREMARLDQMGRFALTCKRVDRWLWGSRVG